VETDSAGRTKGEGATNKRGEWIADGSAKKQANDKSNAGLKTSVFSRSDDGPKTSCTKKFADGAAGACSRVEKGKKAKGGPRRTGVKKKKNERVRGGHESSDHKSKGKEGQKPGPGRGGRGMAENQHWRFFKDTKPLLSGRHATDGLGVKGGGGGVGKGVGHPRGLDGGGWGERKKKALSEDTQREKKKGDGVRD